MWKASLGLYFCHRPFVDTELFQMSPQATWYKGDFGQERQSLYFMWHPDSSQGHESYFPNYWWNLWEGGQCSSCKGGGTSQASLLITPMFQVLTELVPTEGGKKWPQQQMLMKHLLGWAAGETKQQSLSGCVVFQRTWWRKGFQGQEREVFRQKHIYVVVWGTSKPPNSNRWGQKSVWALESHWLSFNLHPTSN